MQQEMMTPEPGRLSGAAVGQNDTPRPTCLKKLVEGVARGTAEFDELIEALMPLLRGSAELPAGSALELSTALIELESASAVDDQLFSLVNTHGAAALALAPSGQILAANAAAAELFQLATGDGLSSLGIGRGAFEEFTRRLSGNPGATLIRGHRTNGGQRKVPILLSGTYSPGYHAFILKALQNYWPDSVDSALGELYGLSVSEREILSALARGMNSDRIAEERKRSVGTVRQQVKSILYKLEVGTQLEAATMAAAAAATAAAAVETTGRTIGHVPRTHRESPLEFGSFFRNRRLAGYRRFGLPAGEPVLLIHGPSFGAGEYAEERRLATKYKLDIHAVERPGYGRTRPPERDEDILECHIADILTYIDTAGLQRLRVVAHEVGLIPALELARRRPELVTGIVSVSAAPPFQELEQLDAMPGQQAIFIQAARQAPWMARLMTRLLTIRTRRLGVERWTDVIFGGLDPDGRVMKNPTLRSGIIGTYSFYLNQMGAGFEQDLQMMLTEWSRLVADLQVPTVLLHGCRNPTTPPAYLEIFRKLNRGLRIELVEDAGLTLAVSHPQLVYEEVTRLPVSRG
jgi:pimeloyl-ACP methyl ester carboxylesterase/DNA-binding CsgD family transcriptional regulator